MHDIPMPGKSCGRIRRRSEQQRLRASGEARASAVVVAGRRSSAVPGERLQVEPAQS